MTEAIQQAAPDPAATGSRPGLVLTERILSKVISLLVLGQAVLAGHSTRLFGGINIEVHGFVGNAVFTLLVVALVLALVTGAGSLRIAVLGALTALAVGQIGLGYMGRTSLDAAGWHVPLGVAIFGLSIYNVMLARDSAKRVAFASS